MNIFAIRNAKELKLVEIDVLSKKDRDPSEAPGVQLAWVGDFSQTVLEQFAPGFAGMLFEPGEQAGVDEESDLTALTDIAKGLGEFSFEAELTGYTGSVNFGAGDKSAIPIAGAMLHAFKFFPKDGGTVLVKFKMDVPNCGEKVLGKFAIHKSQRGELTLLPPEVSAEKPADAGQIGLLSANTGKPPNPFLQDDDDGIDTPEKAAARAHSLP